MTKQPTNRPQKRFLIGKDKIERPDWEEELREISYSYEWNTDQFCVLRRFVERTLVRQKLEQEAKEITEKIKDQL